MKTEKIYTPKTLIYKHSNKLSPSREEKINNNNNEQQISAFSSTDVKLQTCRTTKYQPKTLLSTYMEYKYFNFSFIKKPLVFLLTKN